MASAGLIYWVEASWVAAHTSISSCQQWEGFPQEEPHGTACSLQGHCGCCVRRGGEGGVVREAGAGAL